MSSLDAAYWYLNLGWADIMLLGALSVAGLLARIAFVPLSTAPAEVAIAAAQLATVVGLWLSGVRLRQHLG